MKGLHHHLNTPTPPHLGLLSRCYRDTSPPPVFKGRGFMKCILLVDDDDVFNFLNTKTIQMSGMADEIHTALNGRQALELLNSHYHKTSCLPDAILLDLNMPVMDGFTFLEELKRTNLPRIDEVNIIIVTSSENQSDIARAKKLGVTKYLTKPLLAENLRGALDN